MLGTVDQLYQPKKTVLFFSSEAIQISQKSSQASIEKQVLCEVASKIQHAQEISKEQALKDISGKKVSP